MLSGSSNTDASHTSPCTTWYEWCYTAAAGLPKNWTSAGFTLTAALQHFAWEPHPKYVTEVILINPFQNGSVLSVLKFTKYN